MVMVVSASVVTVVAGIPHARSTPKDIDRYNSASTDMKPCANLTVTWTTPTVEPGQAHRNTNGPVISGGMPLGNGETAVLAFPLVPAAGSNFRLPGDVGAFVLQSSISFFVSMTTAMASDTSLFKLGMVSLVTDPPLFDASEPPLTFEQRCAQSLHCTTHTPARSKLS